MQQIGANNQSVYYQYPNQQNQYAYEPSRRERFRNGINRIMGNY